jgi:hypothetical protein
VICELACHDPPRPGKILRPSFDGDHRGYVVLLPLLLLMLSQGRAQD